MNIKKRFFFTAVWLVICVVAGWIAASAFNLSFWITFAITAIALLANGVIAELEDRIPGGFLNQKVDKFKQ